MSRHERRRAGAHTDDREHAPTALTETTGEAGPVNKKNSGRKKNDVEVVARFVMKQSDGTEVEVDEETFRSGLHKYIDSLPNDHPLREMRLRLSLAAALREPDSPDGKYLREHPDALLWLLRHAMRKGWLSGRSEEEYSDLCAALGLTHDPPAVASKSGKTKEGERSAASDEEAHS